MEWKKDKYGQKNCPKGLGLVVKAAVCNGRRPGLNPCSSKMFFFSSGKRYYKILRCSVSAHSDIEKNNLGHK